MAGDVVCNASPVIFLAKIRKLDLLDIYSLHIPAQVDNEILISSVPEKKLSSVLLSKRK